MKGAVKKNISPPTALAPLKRDVYPAFLKIRLFITTHCGLQKLKSESAVLLPTRVLSEPQGLLLFQVVRGGDRVYRGTSYLAVVHHCG